MSYFTAMASLQAIPRTLCNCNPSNTSSKTRGSHHQVHILNRRKIVFRAMADSNSRHNVNRKVAERSGKECFARVSSATTTNKETTTVSVSPQQYEPPPPSSQFGSPLFWIGVGVGFSALFSWVASNLKKFAMQQAFKAMMGQMNPQNNQFNNSAFSAPSPFPFPMPPTPMPATPSTPAASRTSVIVDVPMRNVEPAPVQTPASTSTFDVKDGAEIKKETRTYETNANKESRKYAFEDVSPEESYLKSPFESLEDVDEMSSSKDVQSVVEVDYQNGAASNQGEVYSQGTQPARPVMSVEALEKMMEDPAVQKMVYPYLPAEMRDPVTFKWMLQNPEYRRQLEEMLTNMGGSPEWDNRMMDSLKNFDMSSPEVKQQFEQIGLTPEEVIAKIMANPDIAMAFQNPRVQQAIMDCSQNPMSIAKYQNDKEVMDVFDKISTLFPGGMGSP